MLTFASTARLRIMMESPAAGTASESASAAPAAPVAAVVARAPQWRGRRQQLVQQVWSSRSSGAGGRTGAPVAAVAAAAAAAVWGGEDLVASAERYLLWCTATVAPSLCQSTPRSNAFSRSRSRPPLHPSAPRRPRTYEEGFLVTGWFSREMEWPIAGRLPEIEGHSISVSEEAGVSALGRS